MRINQWSTIPHADLPTYIPEQFRNEVKECRENDVSAQSASPFPPRHHRPVYSHHYNLLSTEVYPRSDKNVTGNQR